MTKTEIRLRAWLADPSNIAEQTNMSSIGKFVVRNMFVTSNGHEISIQHSALHYCDENSVEMWQCPHRPVLDAYGDGEDPYARVPLNVVADYIDVLEGETLDTVKDM